jgi:Protein of unknown function (DUF2690)
MKRNNIWFLTALIVACIFVVAPVTGTAHANDYGKAGVTHTNSYVGEDPYTSGCSRDAYIVRNSGVYDEHGNVLAIVQMWYSISCVTNWGVIKWNDGSAIGTQIDVWEYNDYAHRKCYPTACSTSTWYAGGLSPSWTDMVDGQNVTCVFGAVLKAGAVYAGSSGLCG